jgi:hypothetical protein
MLVLRETRAMVVDPQGAVLDTDLSGKSTVDRVEIEQVCGALQTALDLVDVGEPEFRMLPHRADRESSDSSESVDADVHAAAPH